MTSELVEFTCPLPGPDRRARHLEAVRPLPSIRPRPLPAVDRPNGIYPRVVKPAMDRVVAVGVLTVAAVPMVGIAAVVAIAMGRPVLFRQRRVGHDGEVFEVLKFRTMRPCRRSARVDVRHDRRRTHKSSDDPRHTRVGRFLRRYSLDELPQLINVLRGEMSIVGPRPELEDVVAAYPDGLEQRHHVRPGLTGLWQISARGAGPMHENGHWDLAYVESLSLRTDLRILGRTPKAIVAANAGE